MNSSGYYVSTDKKKLDLDMIQDYLSNRSYWAKGRSLEQVRKTIEHSLCFGIYNESGKQFGFARVVTDYAVFAWILDLFVLEDFQGKGGGKMLMEAITDHPALQELHRWGLGTKDAHGLYKQYGFEKLLRPDVLMEKVNRRDKHELKAQE